MTSITYILALLLKIYLDLLIVRIVIEMIQSFSRQFRPPRWFALIAEPIFMVTDPPVKAVRKLVPPIQMGGVAMDVSILLLFLIIQVLLFIVLSI
ncbi:YggT family protein [Corynebacterium hindlerae]|uniref:YggT family protein n=1 Tax=Corynebacterium hindlerae TaxID=699041 RepID=A0A7G5FEI7_9CORY|nr:YggT family protein [Corynebacterium hindlerae]QMV85028.1 YggT family protein [Corynebacterium hindlerae]